MESYGLGKFLVVAIALAINTLETQCNENLDDSYPKVWIPQGTLKGFEVTTRNQRTVYGFKGIPFGQPPVGNLRFRAPLAAGGWNGTLDATQDPNVCLQADSSTGAAVGNEDCLYLNVYTPQIEPSCARPMPVMFWIHYGAFKGWSANDAFPNYLLDKDVVLVSANYRLGALGFLSTGDEVSPGNYGMKDQVLALKWVQENIQYFAGDPDRVTIFGSSAGSASVDLLGLSDLTKGLYHRAIQNSGASLSPRGYVAKEVLAKYSFFFGEHLGCDSDTSDALISCLRGIDATEFAESRSMFFKWDKNPDIIWRPTDEPDIEGAFLTDSPKNLYAAGKFIDIPSMSGVTHDEGLYYIKKFYENPELADDFFDKIDFTLPYYLLYHEREDAAEYTAALKSFYLNDLTADKDILLANLTRLVGDRYYIYGTYTSNKNRFTLGKSATYFYSFDYLRSTQYPSDSVVPRGIQHGDDEPFYFPLEPSCFDDGLYDDCDMSEDDFKMVDIYVDLFTSFAKYGIPTTTYNGGVTWNPSSGKDNYLKIGDGPDLLLEMKDSFLEERMNFWKKMEEDFGPE